MTGRNPHIDMSLLLKPNIIRGTRSKKNASIFHVSIKIWDYCKLCFGIFLRQSSVTSFKQRQRIFSFEPSLQKTCISLRSVPVIWLDCLTNVQNKLISKILQQCVSQSAVDDWVMHDRKLQNRRSVDLVLKFFDDSFWIHVCITP